jgi:hypothetical protein
MYRVDFEYADVALELTTYVDADSKDEALETGQERMEVSEETPGTWTVEDIGK